MDYSELEKQIKKISAIAHAVEPAEFRVKCFEVLLKHWIDSSDAPRPEQKVHRRAEESRSAQDGHNLGPLPGVLKGFMKKHKITEAQLGDIFSISEDEDGGIQFAVASPAERVADQVIHWALLSALRNAVMDKGFTVNPEEIRVLGDEQNCYTGNFWSPFDKKKNKIFFSGLLEAQGKKPVALTPKGKTALAKLIHELIGDDS